MLNSTQRCVCGRAYRVYSHFCGDQSRCPQCLRDLEAEIRRHEAEKHDPPLNCVASNRCQLHLR